MLGTVYKGLLVRCKGIAILRNLHQPRRGLALSVDGISIFKIPRNTIPRNTIANISTLSVSPIHNYKKIREEVWLRNNGDIFSNKCYVKWCSNKITVFNFEIGHDIPRARGGTNSIDNLKTICRNCNQSMGARYTIQEWSALLTL